MALAMAVYAKSPQTSSDRAFRGYVKIKTSSPSAHQAVLQRGRSGVTVLLFCGRAGDRSGRKQPNA